MRARPITVLAKIAWAFGVLLVGLAAIGLQMDREARSNGAIAAVVPSVFRGFALETLARQAYAAHDDARGLSYSRELVLRRPAPAETLSLLTRGLLVSGRQDAALAALLVTAQRGWRDRFTQQLMVVAAEQADDPTVAAQRLLALWRLGDRDVQVETLTQNALASENALTQFASGISRSDAWGTKFLIWGAGNLSIHALDIVGAALAKNKVAIDCGALSDTVTRLARTGNGAAATRLWSRSCSKGAVTDVAGFAFRASVDSAGPFDWRLPGQAELDVAVVRDAGGVALRYSNTGQLRVAIASRTAAMTPGAHSVGIEAEGDDGIGTRPIVLRLACISENGRVGSVATMELRRQPTPFQIPVTGCVGQELILEAAHGDGLIRRLVIDGGRGGSGSKVGDELS
jgi:hypothetical protein